MRSIPAVLAPLFLAGSLCFIAGCDPSTPSGPVSDPGTEVDTEVDTDGIDDPTTCEEAEAALDTALERIQSCTTDEQCGQVLTGTSCGCTRDLVARLDADTTRFYELLEFPGDLDCGGFVSTCDCPPTDGFACVEGTCSWNYTP